jgi:predicted signal transduction protein with EAL and GGDEF domain
MDLEDLSDRLHTPLKYVRLHRAEREFLDELIQAYIRSRGRKEITDQKAIAVARHVIWLEEFHGWKTEAAIADAERLFGLKRTRITDILREQRPKWDSLRRMAHSEARQFYALIDEDRAFGNVDEDSPDSYARLLEEVTELAKLEKMDEAMQELAALAGKGELA